MKQYFSFQWHITDACDQRCKHCYIFSENTCKQLDSMSWEQMQDTGITPNLRSVPLGYPHPGDARPQGKPRKTDRVLRF